MQNFRALGAPLPDPRASGGCQTPSLQQLGASPPDLHWHPDPQISPPIANFWLRAWHKACLAKCNAGYVFGNCNDKIVQLEVSTKLAKLKRLECLNRKVCDVARKAALASTKFHNDFSPLSFVHPSKNLISEYLTGAGQPSDLSCDVADASQCFLSVSD